jgi:hypothetical protein
MKKINIVIPQTTYLAWIIAGCLFLSTVAVGNAQILYSTNGNWLVKIDLTTCTVCPITQLNLAGTDGADIVVLPNGNILVFGSGGLRLYDLPNTNPIWSNTGSYGGGILAPNGLVYVTNASNPRGLNVFDPSNNTFTFIGPWPLNIGVSELFYQNGILYGIANLGTSFPFTPVIIEVNISNPSLSVIVVLNSPFVVAGGTTNGGYTSAIDPDGFRIDQYDVSTNSFNTVCNFTPGSGFFQQSTIGLSDLPVGVPVEPCQCITNAGTVSNILFQRCVPGSLSIPYNNNAVLDNNDILRYILYTNPSDPEGSILVESSGPVIAFDPAIMQTGITYYIATIAGNSQNGTVDLSDPCLDVSNTVAQVIWRPRPQLLALASNNPNICPVNGCTTVTATFSGSPPFVFVYEFQVNGSLVGTPFTVNAPTSPHTFTVCPPVATGQVELVICSVGDQFCSNP